MTIKEIIKKNILAVVALATVIGFSAFKLTDDPESGWYEIVPLPGGSFDDPAYQRIASYYGPTLPSGDCQATNTEEKCAVKLNLTNFDEPEIINMSVHDAVETYEAELDDSESDGYARRDD